MFPYCYFSGVTVPTQHVTIGWGHWHVSPAWISIGTGVLTLASSSTSLKEFSYILRHNHTEERPVYMSINIFLPFSSILANQCVYIYIKMFVYLDWGASHTLSVSVWLRYHRSSRPFPRMFHSSLFLHENNLRTRFLWDNRKNTPR